MKNLWILGDNSSAIFGNTTERRFYHYNKFRNGIFPKTWSELLSDKIQYRLRNLATGGESNYDIFNQFCRYCQNIKSDDIVIIGWASLNNFRLVDSYQKKFVSIRENATNWKINRKEFLNGITTETISEILKNRNQNNWISEIYDWENIINYLSKIIGFKIYFWSFDNRINKIGYIGGNVNDFREYLISLGAEDITKETNGKLIDKHFGEIGQMVQYEYFLKQIINENINLHNT